MYMFELKQSDQIFCKNTTVSLTLLLLLNFWLIVKFWLIVNFSIVDPFFDRFSPLDTFYVCTHFLDNWWKFWILLNFPVFINYLSTKIGIFTIIWIFDTNWEQKFDFQKKLDYEFFINLYFGPQFREISIIFRKILFFQHFGLEGLAPRVPFRFGPKCGVRKISIKVRKQIIR